VNAVDREAKEVAKALKSGVGMGEGTEMTGISHACRVASIISSQAFAVSIAAALMLIDGSVTDLQCPI